MRRPPLARGHRGRLRRGLPLALCAVALGALGGCGGANSPSATRTAAATTPGGAHSTTTRTTVLGARPPARPPALRRLQAGILRALRRAGPGAGVYVVDLSTGQVLFTRGAARKRPPASVEKLYTSVVALRLLGAGTRLHTDLLATGRLSARGVWDGNLYLRGGGDPTFGDGTFNRTFEQGYGPTAAQLAGALRRRGIRRVTGELFGDGSLFTAAPGGPATGFAPDVPDFGGELGGLVFDHGATLRARGPAAFAAHQLAATLRAQGVRVRAAPTPVRAPAGAKLLASVASPPLSVLLRLMDVPSDDLFAELLTEQLGVRFGAGGTIPAGARVIATQIAADYGLFPRIVDGSGLSRLDASSPVEVVDLLRDVWHTPTGALLAQSLPVIGVSGTVAGLARGTPAAGRCLTKTGTLNGVTNLAGYCLAANHHTLAFAAFVDGPPNWIAEPMLGRVAAALARY